MKKITLAIDNALLSKMGLAENAAEDAVVLGIKNALDKAEKYDKAVVDFTNMKKLKEDAEAELETLKASAITNEVKTMLDKAVADKKITNELSAQFAKDYATNSAGLKTVLEAMQPVATIKKALSDKPAGGVSKITNEHLAWGYDDFKTKDPDGKLLADLKNNHEDRYNAIYKEKFPG